MRFLKSLIALLIAPILMVLSGCANLDLEDAYSITVHSQGSAAEAPRLAFLDTIGNPPRTVYFKTIPEVTHREMIAFYPFAADDGETYGAACVLDTMGKRALFKMSNTRQGEYARVFVDRKPVDLLYIDGTINDGILVIWQGITAETLGAMEEAIQRLEVYPAKPKASPEAGYNIFDEMAGTER